MFSRRTFLMTGAIIALALLLFWARQQPSLQPWVQLTAIVLVSGGLYWYGWDGQADVHRYRGFRRGSGPIWLTLLCARPEERLVVLLAFLQVGSIGFGLGSIIGFAFDTYQVHFYGILGLVVAIVLTGSFWVLWSAWRWLAYRSRS